MNLVVEAMTDDDWPAVRTIYEEGIATGNATFQTEVPLWEEWNQEHLLACRLVARVEGAAVGWAALTPTSGRCVYGGVADVSIYVAKVAWGQGVGRALLQALVVESERVGIWTLQAGIFPENRVSLALHERCGFRTVGIRERLDRWTASGGTSCSWSVGARLSESEEESAMHSEGREPSGLPVSRRGFLGFVLGAAAALAAACGRATPVPEPTVTPASVADLVPLATVAPPTATPVPPSATNIAASVPPTLTQTPAASPSATAVPPSVAEAPTLPPPSAPSATTIPPTYTPVPATPTSPPAPTTTPEAEKAVPGRDELMAHWPATGTSRVVVVRHGGVWTGDAPDPALVLQMLDDGMRTLVGVGDAMAVWRALFAPGERVLLKVNCIAYGGPTQPAVTYAVAQRLQEAGVRAEDILIFDRTDHELRAAGYAVNDGGGGVQCHGTRGNGTEITLSQARVRFYREIDECDAIVNLPTPKQHTGAGVSVALKNHYGSVDQPARLHGNLCDPGIAELNAQPAVRDKTRLVVGAALKVSPGDWNQPKREDAVLLSFDPVALDTVARDMLVRQREALGTNPSSLVERSHHLRTAQGLKLGATDAGLIDLREVTLG